MLERIQEINIPQKIWYGIIGKTKPNMLTQISVAIGLCIWFYLFSWHLISFLSLSLMDTLDKAVEIENAFNRIGGKYQTFLPGNITTYLWIHALVQVVIYAISLTGLILIWRQKKLGFVFYISANIATYLASFFIMGMYYMYHELKLIDFILLLAITLYFALGYWLFYRNK